MYSQAWVQDLVGKIQDFMRDNTEWLGLDTTSKQRLLDYACGHGTISLVRQPHNSFVVVSLLTRLQALVENRNLTFRGIDLHPKQVERYNNEAARLLGEEQTRMLAVQGDLDNPSVELSGQEWHNFDVAVFSMALHHVPEPVGMLSNLRKRLRPGGALVVVEWYEEGIGADETSGSDNLDRDDMIVVNKGEKIWAGFTPLGIDRLFERAGFAHVDVQKPDISFQIPEEVSEKMSGKDKKLMFVKGVNASSEKP